VAVLQGLSNSGMAKTYKILWISLTADFAEKTDWMMENAED